MEWCLNDAQAVPVVARSSSLERCVRVLGLWGLLGDQWCQVPWSEWPGFASASLAAKELPPIIVATTIWGPWWKHSGHSFQIGVATTAALVGIEDSLIKTLGRWESAAYLLNIRVPQDRLTSVSRRLSVA